MSQMLAAVYHGPEDLRLERRAVPSIGDGELLLKVEAASICATDLRIYRGQHRKFGPDSKRIPGHEIVGTVAEAGAEVSGLETGQRVFLAPNVGCGDCPQCRHGMNNLCPDSDAFGITLDGGFAEYVRVTSSAVDQGNVMTLAETADVTAAPLIEPFACVLRGQDQVSVGDSDTVLILGAGPIGLMHVLLARANGARRIVVTDQIESRLQKAMELGADRAVNFQEQAVPEVVSAETSGNGADVVIVAAPAHKAMEDALELAAPGGRINYFAGLPKDRPEIRFNANLVHYKELLVTGSTACSTDDCRRAAKLVSEGAVDLSGLISARFPLQSVTDAFREASSADGLKVVVEP